MVARVNGNYNAGQFIGHSVDHFVVDCKSDISAKYDIGGTVGEFSSYGIDKNNEA